MEQLNVRVSQAVDTRKEVDLRIGKLLVKMNDSLIKCHVYT